MWTKTVTGTGSGRARRGLAVAALVAATTAVGAVAGLGPRAPAQLRLAPLMAGVHDVRALAAHIERAWDERPRTVPGRRAIASASSYAAARGGAVSFAAIDSRGRLRGRAVNRRYSAASVVKAMVLAAELRRLAPEPLDPLTRHLLGAMITHSDNAAADAIYARVGDVGMLEVAERTGMERFEIAGHWGNARIAAADMARFFGDLDRILPRRHRDYGKGLFGSIDPSQSWGIPDAAGDRWGVRLKGGWLPDRALVHQAAELRERSGPREVSLAILTDEMPSHEYGIETVRGIAARLLGAGPQVSGRKAGG